MREYLVELIHTVSPGCAVATVIPLGIREEELVEMASTQRFDLAILVLNNVNFYPYDLGRRSATLASDGVALVRKMKELALLTIALYGWPRNARHSAILIQAGAMFALKLPFNDEEMKEALRQSMHR